MNKSVLMSIQPKWCELIASGKKTIEVRKTMPKLETPFKCYIYETFKKESNSLKWVYGEWRPVVGRKGRGKVIGEFVCDNIETLRYRCDGYGDEWHEWNDEYVDFENMCLSEGELEDYLGTSNGYGLHISDLRIYDKPRELGEFRRECKQYGAENPLCDDCRYFDCCRGVDYDESDCVVDGLMPLTCAPQSWCYVEELKD